MIFHSYRRLFAVTLIFVLVLGTFTIATAQDQTVVTYWTWNAAGFGTNQTTGELGPQQAAFNAAHPEIDLQVEIYSYQDYLKSASTEYGSRYRPRFDSCASWRAPEYL